MPRTKETRLEVAFKLLHSLTRKENAYLEFLLGRQDEINIYKRLLNYLKEQNVFDHKRFRKELLNSGLSSTQIRNNALYLTKMLSSIKGFDPLNRSEEVPVFFTWARVLSEEGFKESAIEVAMKGIKTAEANEDWGFSIQGMIEIDRIMDRHALNEDGEFQIETWHLDLGKGYIEIAQNLESLKSIYNKLLRFEQQWQESREKSFCEKARQIVYTLENNSKFKPQSRKAKIVYYLCLMVGHWMQKDLKRSINAGEKGLETIEQSAGVPQKYNRHHLKLLSQILLLYQVANRPQKVIEVFRKIFDFAPENKSQKALKIYQISFSFLEICSGFGWIDQILECEQWLSKQKEFLILLPPKNQKLLYLFVSNILLFQGNLKKAKPWIKSLNQIAPPTKYPWFYTLGKIIQILFNLESGQNYAALSTISYTLKHLPDSHRNGGFTEILRSLKFLSQSKNEQELRERAQTILKKHMADDKIWESTHPLNLREFIESKANRVPLGSRIIRIARTKKVPIEYKYFRDFSF